MKDTKKAFWINLFIVVALIAIVTIRSIVGGDSADFALQEDSLSFSGPGEFAASVEFKNVASIEYREEFDRGSCITGGSQGSYTYGTWENDELGQYTLHVLTKVKACIVITETDGNVFVFNIENAKTTEAFSDNLIEYLQENGYSLS